jgi:hypothetical protein
MLLENRIVCKSKGDVIIVVQVADNGQKKLGRESLKVVA